MNDHQRLAMSQCSGDGPSKPPSISHIRNNLVPDGIQQHIAGLASDDVEARRTAAESCAQLGESARAAAVALATACNDDDETVREWAAAALEGLGPPPPSDVDLLARLLASESSGDVGYWAATLLGRLGSEAASSVGALVVALQTSAAVVVRQRAAWALGQIGPPAKAALGALQSAASGGGNDDPRLARLAAQAIERIGGRRP